jgi:formyl-CoA transferase
MGPREGLDGDIQVLRSGFTIEGAEPDVDLPPPWLGEHTDSILTELGYDAAEIAALHERGDV